MLGKALLWVKNRFSLFRMRCTQLGSDRFDKKVIILGYGRSGSTLLTKFLAIDNYVDLGEPLRTRKHIKGGFWFRKSCLSQLEAMSNYYARHNSTGVVAHIKPYHCLYWDEDWVSFIKLARSRGWSIIGLRRDFCDRWFSEMRARARGTWTGDGNAIGGDWVERFNWEVFEQESLRDIKFERQLNGLVDEEVVLDIVNYENDLASDEARAGLGARLKLLGVNSWMRGLPKKHASRGRLDRKGELFQKMGEMHNRNRMRGISQEDV